MRWLRDAMYLSAATATSPVWAWRMHRTGKLRTDWKARFGEGEALARTGRPRILIHAVSVGEVNAMRQLVQRLAADPLGPEIVIATTTDTGFARASELYTGRHPVVRYPFDASWMVGRFLDRVQPDLVALTELELWPNFVDECAARSITLMAPSKTYNVPGLGCAFAVIPDAGLRRAFRRAMDGIVPHVNLFGLVACEAALRHGGAWHRDLIAYLAANRDAVQAAVATLPGLAMAPVEATYLAWIDARGLGQTRPAAHLERHGLGLSEGADFGAPGWVRLNFGCPRTTLDSALARLAAACAP